MVIFLQKHYESELGAKGQPLDQLPVLEVQNAKSGVRTGYKETWKDSNFLHSMQQHSMYEAGGSAFWCAMSLNEKQSHLDLENMSWDQMVSLSEGHWSDSRKINGWLQWPVTLHCFVTEQEIVDGAGLENMLRQQPRAFRLTSGAPCLLTFWHAIAVALKEGKAERVLLLCQAALSATMQVRKVKDHKVAAKLAIDHSAKYKADAIAMGEDYLNWLLRWRVAMGDVKSTVPKDVLSHAKLIGLCLDGKELSLNAVTATYPGLRSGSFQFPFLLESVFLIRDCFLPFLHPRLKISGALGAEEMQRLNKICRTFGRGLLTTHFTKLQRIVYGAQRHVAACNMLESGCCSPLSWVFESIYIALDRKQVSESFFTAPNLAAEGKNSKPGFADLSLCKMVVMRWISTFVSPLQSTELTEAWGHLAFLLQPSF